MEIDTFIQRLNGKNRPLIHFTDASNLPSIRAHGLLSMRELRERGIVVPAPGGNEWSHEADLQAGMDGYVHVALKMGHPMEKTVLGEGRIKDIRYIRIDPSVIKLPDVLGTFGVSNKSGIVAVSASEFAAGVDFDILYNWHDYNDPAVQARLQPAEKCELLIPKMIALDLLKIP